MKNNAPKAWELEYEHVHGQTEGAESAKIDAPKAWELEYAHVHGQTDGAESH